MMSKWGMGPHAHGGPRSPHYPQQAFHGNAQQGLAWRCASRPMSQWGHGSDRLEEALHLPGRVCFHKLCTAPHLW